METIMFLDKDPYLWQLLLMAIVLDVTAEAYTRDDFTFENISEPQHPGLLHATINRIFPGFHPYCLTSDESDEDESDVFMQKDIPVFSLCIPVRPHSALKNEDMDVWMHSDRGIFVRQASLEKYQHALLKVSAGLLEQRNFR